MIIQSLFWRQKLLHFLPCDLHLHLFLWFYYYIYPYCVLDLNLLIVLLLLLPLGRSGAQTDEEEQRKGPENIESDDPIFLPTDLELSESEQSDGKDISILEWSEMFC